MLGLVVLIRTLLSFSLEIEIEGTLPWRRALLGSAARWAPRPDGPVPDEPAPDSATPRPAPPTARR